MEPRLVGRVSITPEGPVCAGEPRMSGKGLYALTAWFRYFFPELYPSNRVTGECVQSGGPRPPHFLVGLYFYVFAIKNIHKI